MIFLDLSGIFYLSLYNLEKNNVQLSVESLSRSLAQSIYWYKKKFSEEYGELVICCDSKKNWRRDIFPYYKQRRRDKRDNDEKDWNAIFDMFSLVKTDFSKNLKEVVLEVDGLEGDDLIALGTKLINRKPHLIISSDKDMTQLINNNVKMFHVLHQEFPEFDPKAFILQILKGDRSDGIPSILCPDDYYVNGGDIRRLTKKYTESVQVLTEEEIRRVFADQPDVDKIVRNLKRNICLIDLRYIPKKYHEEFKKVFLESYNKQKQNNSEAYFQELGINME